MAPEGPQLFLAPDIPDGEQDILVLDLLNIEACIPSLEVMRED